MRTYVRMGNAGHPRARLQRALERGSLTSVLAAAAEVKRLELGDALAICAVVAREEPEEYSRYAVRWVQLLLERRQPALGELAGAIAALVELGVERDLASARLRLGRLI